MINIKKFDKFLAFTLAETLIVIGIIGVVAALTIPNLSQNTGEKEKVAKVKKIYSNLEDALGRTTAQYGPLDEWYTNNNIDDNKKLKSRMEDFLKISKSENDTALILADGTQVTFWGGNDICNDSYAEVAELYSINSPLNYVCTVLNVDIDGSTKGKNKPGSDIFVFYVTKDSVYPKGSKLDGDGYNDSALTSSCFKNNNDTCTGWVIENGNMDYLKATNGTCPNGTVLSWTNTTCK